MTKHFPPILKFVIVGDRQILLYYVIVVTVGLNVVLFTATSLKMRKLRKGRTMTKDARNKYNDQWERETYALFKFFL